MDCMLLLLSCIFTAIMLPAKGFRTVAIDTQIPWPTQTQILTFRGREFHLLPETEQVSRMIRVQTSEDLTQAEADKIGY
jgi:hypothetical protein